MVYELSLLFLFVTESLLMIRGGIMKRYIRAASNPDSVLDEKLDNVKADFDYIIDGLDKLSRMGLEKDALAIVDSLQNTLVEITSQVSSNLIR